MISRDDSRLMQLQTNRIYVNWRNRPGGEAYPRYPAIIHSLRGALEAFGAVVEGEKLGRVVPEACELSYINHLSPIEDSSEWLERHFVDMHWSLKQHHFLPAPKEFWSRLRFEMPGEGATLQSRIYPGKRAHDGEEVSVWELSARSKCADGNLDTALKWFEIGHEWIVRGFTDLSNPEAQRTLWRREI
jgi:uncharacterized protein (TIGR04255 family)